MREPAASALAQRDGWRAQLELVFDASAVGTRLASRRHSGPLVVQRPFYPEGPAVCHAIVVHPPGGIAGGDALGIDIEARTGAHATLTTPAAGKLYKSAGRVASQRVRLVARASACIEWLPQETIVFDSADASLGLDIEVAAGALVLGWEIMTLGREAMGERFSEGRLRTRLTVRTGDRLALWEAGDLRGDGAWLASPVGWRNARACGTFVIAGRRIDDDVLDRCREAIVPWGGTTAVSRLEPALLVARYLGRAASEAREAFIALWKQVRPALAGREAVAPRIWST